MAGHLQVLPGSVKPWQAPGRGPAAGADLRRPGESRSVPDPAIADEHHETGGLPVLLDHQSADHDQAQHHADDFFQHLAALRGGLMQGDWRLVYLMWLKAFDFNDGVERVPLIQFDCCHL